jgi:acyl-CoA synthetase (AMP-forming)/AMP-acid ligase II
MAEHGLQRGDVCILVLSSDEFCSNVLMGCLLLGALPLLVAPPVVRGLHSNLREVVRHVTRKTSARMVVLGEASASIADELRQSSRLRILSQQDSFDGGDADVVSLAHPRADDVAALQLTSGTTGFPRVCVWKQEGVLAALDGMAAAMDLRGDDVCVNWTPLYHDMGLVNNFFTCVTKNVPLVMLETMEFARRPVVWLRVLSDAKATVTWSPNFGFAITAQRVRDSELEGIRLDHVRSFWNAAERIHYETVMAFHERFEPYGVTLDALKMNFGCAENVGGATFSDPNGRFVVEHVDRRTLHEKGVAIPTGGPGEDQDKVSIVGVGRPHPGMSIQILSRTGQPLPDGHIGEIGLITPSRLAGYLKDARETRRALYGKHLRTGDFGYMRGEEVFWTGRVRERINLHGDKFDPSDFEQALLDIAGLRKGCFAAFGVDDAEVGTQRLVIVVEVRKTNTRRHDEILNDVRGQIARQSGITVHDIVLLPHGSMAKTSSGKRRHRFYRGLYMENKLEPVASLRKP